MARLQVWAGTSETSLRSNVISTKILFAGSYGKNECHKYPRGIIGAFRCSPFMYTPCYNSDLDITP